MISERKCVNSNRRRSKRNHPEQQKEAVLYYRDNWCGRQNIALCGHCDSGTDMEGVQAATTNHGNFCALLNFYISVGDTILRDNLQSAARNATYSSPDIQNKLISVLGDHGFVAVFCYTLNADEV